MPRTRWMPWTGACWTGGSSEYKWPGMVGLHHHTADTGDPAGGDPGRGPAGAAGPARTGAAHPVAAGPSPSPNRSLVLAQTARAPGGGPARVPSPGSHQGASHAPDLNHKKVSQLLGRSYKAPSSTTLKGGVPGCGAVQTRVAVQSSGSLRELMALAVAVQWLQLTSVARGCSVRVQSADATAVLCQTDALHAADRRSGWPRLAAMPPQPCSVHTVQTVRRSGVRTLAPAHPSLG